MPLAVTSLPDQALVASQAWSPRAARGVLLLTITFALAASVAVTGPGEASQAAARAGADLARLLQFMAGLKTLIAAGVTAAVLWRLAVPVTPLRLAAYAATGAITTAGLWQIGSTAHVGVGAVMVDGGLMASVLLLWRDPAVSGRIGAIVQARRAAIRRAANG